MSSLYDKIMSSKGSFERLAARIPGFKGYQDKQARRTADRLLRDHVAAKIDDCIQGMVRVEKVILDNGGLSYMSKTRNVKGKIQLYHDRVATATPKYSGMFAQVKVDTDVLERIYTFDEAQLEYVEQVDAAIEALKQAAFAKDGIDEAIMNLDDVVTEANDAFLLRDDEILNLEDSI